MRRASASDSSPGAQQPRPRSAPARFAAGALAVAVAVGAPALAFAADGDDDGDTGQLNLNTTVLVNDAVGAGSTGDFAIRGSLFAQDLTARADARRVAIAERLNAVDTLDFASSESTGIDYRPVRAGLFEDYSSQGALEVTRDDENMSSMVVVAAAVVIVPVVLMAGALLGRFWVRRRKTT